MTVKITHHPSESLLKQFYAGQLAAGPSAAVAAHLELCACCQQSSSQRLDHATDDWLKLSENAGSFNDSEMLANIMAQPQALPTVSHQRVSDLIHLPENSVRVPQVLAKSAGEALHWKKLPGGINHANVSIDSRAQCDFLYMKPGSQIPSHKHQGMEITMVLDGTFSDEEGLYQPGDFIVRTGDDCHQATTQEGCLCFTVLENPVIFTSGLARVLNPINRYLFKRG